MYVFSEENRSPLLVHGLNCQLSTIVVINVWTTSNLAVIITFIYTVC